MILCYLRRKFWVNQKGFENKGCLGSRRGWSCVGRRDINAAWQLHWAWNLLTRVNGAMTYVATSPLLHFISSPPCPRSPLSGACKLTLKTFMWCGLFGKHTCAARLPVVFGSKLPPQLDTPARKTFWPKVCRLRSFGTDIIGGSKFVFCLNQIMSQNVSLRCFWVPGCASLEQPVTVVGPIPLSSAPTRDLVLPSTSFSSGQNSVPWQHCIRLWSILYHLINKNTAAFHWKPRVSPSRFGYLGNEHVESPLGGISNGLPLPLRC